MMVYGSKSAMEKLEVDPSAQFWNNYLLLEDTIEVTQYTDFRRDETYYKAVGLAYPKGIYVMPPAIRVGRLYGITMAARYHLRQHVENPDVFMKNYVIDKFMELPDVLPESGNHMVYLLSYTDIVEVLNDYKKSIS